MTASDLFASVLILDGESASSRDAAIQAILDRLAADGHIDPTLVPDFVQSCLRREEISSSGLGGGLALPLMRHPRFSRPCFGALAVSRQPIDFHALDADPVDLVLMMITSPDQAHAYLHLLTQVSRLVRDARLALALRGARDENAIRAILGAIAI